MLPLSNKNFFFLSTVYFYLFNLSNKILNINLIKNIFFKFFYNYTFFIYIYLTYTLYFFNIFNILLRIKVQPIKKKKKKPLRIKVKFSYNFKNHFSKILKICYITKFLTTYTDFKFFFWDKFKSLYFLKYHLYYKKKITPNILLKYTQVFKLFLKKISKIYFNLKIYNISDSILTSELISCTRLIKKYIPFRLKFIYIEEIAEIFLITFISKNLFFLVNWIKKNIEKRSLKLFKTFIFFINFIIYKYFWKKRVRYTILGYFIKFKGKFIKGGGKKKENIYERGIYSSTTKALRFSYKFFFIRTMSGVIGCKIKLAY